jgi:hypothetical protein
VYFGKKPPFTSYEGKGARFIDGQAQNPPNSNKTLTLL